MAESLDFARFANIIDGKVSPTADTRHGVNPATGAALWPSPVSTAADVEAAVRAARAAFPAWKKTSVAHRKQQLQALAAALAALKTEFGQLLTAEQGKATFFAEQEVDFGVGWLAGTCALDLPEDVVEDSAERRIVTQYVPLGVAVGIVPWNFPIMLLCGKLAPAVLSGNCILLKPSPFTPYCGLKIVELAQRFFPPGVVQALAGGDDLGPLLTAHPGIDKISFTGSTATGKRVMASASQNLTRVTLELGGNDAAIVRPDVDVAQAAADIANVAFMNAGQICIAVKRVFVHADVYDAFKTAFAAHVAALKVGAGTESGVFVGPVQNKMQFARVQAFLADIRTQGQAVLTGGATGDAGDGAPGAGYFVQPTVVDDPADDSMVVAQEAFGPVVPLLRWTDEAEVLRRVNSSDMGLGASIWTRDPAAALRMSEELDVGSVWINKHLAIQPTAAFGGHKKSGIGAEWGRAGLRGYCNTRTVYVDK